MTETTRYSTTQIVLHWLVAILIAGQYLFKEPISQAWDAISRDLPVSFNPLVLAHVAGGMLILVLVAWRLFFRARRGAPPPPANEPALLRLAARLTHWTLYGLLVAMAISGMMAWFGHVTAAAQAHGILKTMLMALIVLHILAVIFHHLVLKNPIMQRMVRRKG